MISSNNIYKLMRFCKKTGVLGILWSCVLLLGGIVLLLFSLSNGFLPDLDLSEASSLLISAAFMSATLILFFAFMIFAGGLIIYTWFFEWPHRERGCITLVCIAVSAVLVFLIFLLAERWSVTKTLFIALFLAPLLSFVIIKYCLSLKMPFWKKTNPWGKFCIIILSTFSGICFTLISIWVFTSLYQKDPKTTVPEEWVILAFWMLIQVLCIFFVASSYSFSSLFKRCVGIGGIGVLLLFTLANSSNFIIQRVVQLLGVGAITNVSLVVTQEGCEVLFTLSDGDLCTHTSDRTAYHIESVTLRSRFGKQVLIGYTPEKRKGDGSAEMERRIILEATELLGWQKN